MNSHANRRPVRVVWAALLTAMLAGVSPKAMAQTPVEPVHRHAQGQSHNNGRVNGSSTKPAVTPAPMPAAMPAATPLERESNPPIRWQDANQAVGQFPRGHADVLRWEKTHTPPPQEGSAHPDAGQLTLALAMRWAQQDQTSWIQPGMSAQERAEAGQQAAALRWQVQKLWVGAVVSRQSVAHSRDILAVAEAGAELGQRMASVGNWSRARQMQEELPLWAARARLDQAQLQAERALQALWQRVGARMTAAAVAQQLPLHLPAQQPFQLSSVLPSLLPVDSPESMPAVVTPTAGADQAAIPLDDVAALQAVALQAHLRWNLEEQQAQRLMSGLGMSDADLQAAQQAWRVQAGQDVPVWRPRNALWGHAFEKAWQARTQADRLARQVRADVQMALSAYQMARHAAHTTQAEVLRLHTELTQETLLRYNGMLKSTWDLLASARTRIDSVDAALQAQRQAWLAHADLMAVLAGLPYTASVDASGSSATSANSKPNTAGH